MLNFSGAVLRRGPRVLLDDLTFSVYRGQRVGVVGRNGTGKSSLFAMILGDLPPDAGDFSRPADLAIATVRQETPALPQAAIDYVLDGDAALRSAEAALAQAEERGDGSRVAAAHEDLHTLDGYTAQARAARLLHGLGFVADTQVRPVASFSGGWRMRLNLARALMSRSDLLLLDEPTNHLDLDAVLWLQGHLQDYPGSLLVISHDRDFLDAVTTHTLYLEGQQATLYGGNYSTCEQTRATRMAQQAAEYVTQSRRAAQLQSFVDRFRAKATKARQAQSRIKQLERMQLSAPAHWSAPFDFEFLEPQRLPSPLLQLKLAELGYPDRAVLSGVRLGLEPGDRIGLLGHNGAGKTTLIRSLAGELRLRAGEIHRDAALRCGYFAQHQVDQLEALRSPVEHLRALDPAALDQQLRDFLGGFDFRGDRVFEPVSGFSGGEKARLALALTVYQRPNLLLLDEPTNHLDIEMRFALERALQGFAGAVIVVSHDRHLLTSCCDQLWLVADGACIEYDGDLEDYARLVRSEDRGGGGSGSGAVSDAPQAHAARERRRASAARREQLKPLRQALKAHERRIDQLKAELDELHRQMADPEFHHGQASLVAQAATKLGQLQKSLDDTEQAWLDTLEELERLEG